MTIDNIALVRATNVIPFDGIVRPVSNDQYICKTIGTKLSYMISDWLRKEGMLPTITPEMMFSDNYDELVAKNSRLLKEYLPYTSDYNSFVLFSLNGICPDDNENGFANNTFSNKKVGIIEPLSKHIHDVVSLYPTDTAIKGDVTLSSDAILLIEERYYESLSDEQKDKLNNGNFTLKLFNGDLKDAIEEELALSDKYVPEVLSLSTSSRGFIPSDTSEEQLECIDEIARTYDLAQMKFFNLITTRDTSLPCYDLVSSEVENINLVQDYYIKKFMIELLSHIGVDQNDVDRLSNIIDKKAQEEIVKILDSFGVENFLRFVSDYNRRMEEQRKNNELETPEEVVNLIRSNQRII